MDTGVVVSGVGADPTTALLQYGALGAITLVALLAVKVMFNRLVEQSQGEKDRADRLEEELRKLNDAVRGEYLNTIAQATRAVADALAAVRHRE